MKVLVICPTYGRLPYLGRMVASFLSQTYKNSDLVIINDDPNVQLKFYHDRVTVVNISKKHLLDVKRNIGAVMGRNYDLIMPLDDDDIFLPKQIEYHVSKFENNPDLTLFRNIRSFIVYGGEFKFGSNAPNSIAYRPDAFFACGGYNHFEKNSGGDTKFYRSIGGKIEVRDKENSYFVYNFSGVNYHLSCIDETKIEGVAERQLKSMNCSGEFVIVPDFEEFQKFITLSETYIQNEVPIPVRAVSEGKIIFGDDVR
jgi:glycosyltransferase involved in cell wall biosynthesis